MVIALALVGQVALAQTKVSGTVVDETGLPLPGAGVVEAGTTNGTITDLDGLFTLSVSAGASIEVSFVGYTTVTVPVPADGKPLTVTLSEDQNILNEVVVVGYGTMQRKDVTSSITTIKSDNLNKGVFTDAGSMLQGKVAGLTVTTNGDPNGGASMTLRGASSLRGGAMSPYYVVDGIPGIDISMVAPEDIESIDVLRDATATAIYGSKAANGVIMVTTKKGKKGQERVNVSYSGYVAFDNILNKLQMASADELRKRAAADNITITDDNVDTNWADQVLRTAVSHNHNLSINGGSKSTTYMASVNYMDRQGVVLGSHMDRINARGLVTTKVLKDHLELSAGVNAMFANHVGVPMGTEGASVLDAMYSYSPTRKVKNDDGTWTKGVGSKNYNPLSLIYEDPSGDFRKRMQFLGKATVYIIDGLTWTTNASFSNYQTTQSLYDTRNSQIDFPAALAKKNGQANRNTNWGSEKNLETYGNYDAQFGKNKLGLMAGYSWEQREYGDGFGVTVHDFYNDLLKWNNLSYASTIDSIDSVSGGVKETVRNISFYGRLTYSYDSRYLLQATIRRDGSSVFGANHQWGTFPSVSLAWNIAEEGFMKSQNVVDQLKLRAGYGVSGNAMGFGAYTAIPTFGPSGNFEYNGKTWRTLAATKNANPDLKWESTGMFNVGVDYGFLHGRINGSIEFYNKVTTDLIWNYPVSTNIYPFGSIDANVGQITNRGVEFTINASVIEKKDFNWNTTLTLAHNRNRVDRVSSEDGKFNVGRFTQGDPMIAGVSSNGYTQRIIEGMPIGTFYTHKFAGYDNDGHALYYKFDDNGNQTSETVRTADLDDERDRTVTGCAQPKLNLGWNNTFSWKNWSATMFFTGVFGNQIYDGIRAYYNSPSLLAGEKNVLKEFCYDHPVGNTDTNVPSDRWIEKGDYLRLQTLTLGYTFKKFNDWIQSLNLYVTCNNVFTITGYKGLDPEVNLGGIDPGIEYRWSTYPHTRTVMVGARINF